MFWNPFSHLGISAVKNYPLAKVRRSSFFERVVDTFKILNGEIDPATYSYDSPEEQVSHVGIIDYLVFPIFLPLTYALNNYSGEHKAKLVMLLNVIKFPFVAVLTLLASLSFVAGFHIFRLIANAIQDGAVKNLKIIGTLSKQTKHVFKTTSSFEKCLSELSDYGGTLKLTFKKEDSSLYVNVVTGGPALYVGAQEEGKVYFPVGGKMDENTLYMTDTRIPITKENAPYIRWMLESNFCDVTNNIVNDEEMEHFLDEQKLTKPA